MLYTLQTNQNEEVMKTTNFCVKALIKGVETTKYFKTKAEMEQRYAKLMKVSGLTTAACYEGHKLITAWKRES